jgi:hypothetical protein
VLHHIAADFARPRSRLKCRVPDVVFAEFRSARPPETHALEKLPRLSHNGAGQQGGGSYFRNLDKMSDLAAKFPEISPISPMWAARHRSIPSTPVRKARSTITMPAGLMGDRK